MPARRGRLLRPPPPPRLNPWIGTARPPGLNAQKGVFAAGTSNGATNTVDLPAGFDLKAVIFWTADNTGAGATNGNAKFSVGFATKDSGSIQQGYLSSLEGRIDPPTIAARAINSDATLRPMISTTQAAEMDVTTLSPEQFIATWTVAYSAAIKVHYLALGGAAISAARCFNFAMSTAAATQDVTISTGFGQPDLLLFLNDGYAAAGPAAGDCQLALGAAKSASERRHSLFQEVNGQFAAVCSSHQADRALVTVKSSGGVPSVDAEADLSAQSEWPADGFELTYADQASQAAFVVGLALRGLFSSSIGAASVPTTPQDQDLLHAVVPKAALLWGTPLPNASGLNTTHADLGGFAVGGTDTVNEGVAGVTQEDGSTGTSSNHSESKAFQEWTPDLVSTALASEADASISGSSLRLAWADADTVAREFGYLLLGDPALSASITIQPSASRISRVAGKDLTTFSFRSSLAYAGYELRVVPDSTSPHTAGTLIESGGSGPAGGDREVTITDDELVAASSGEGVKVIKVFVQDSLGNWSI